MRPKPTHDELTARAPHAVFLEFWTDAEDDTLAESPFDIFAAVSPPAWLVFHGAWAQAVTAGAGLLGLSTLISLVLSPFRDQVPGLVIVTNFGWLGLQIVCGLWAHAWLYQAVLADVRAARSGPDPLAELRRRAQPNRLGAAAAFVAYVALQLGAGLLARLLGEILSS